MNSTIDTERIKASVNLVDLAGRYSSLRKVAAQEWAGPCPKCRGEDRFHVHEEGWFFCRKCHAKRADAIEFLTWVDNVGFREACERLGGGGTALPTIVVRRQPDRKRADWQDPDWQRQVEEALATAIERLKAPQAGAPGREYLAGRRILPEAREAWGLGFDSTKYDPVTERKRPAIVLPWYWGEHISALKYRFIDDLGKQKEHRFTQKGGGEQRLFGLQLRSNKSDTLVLVEGELNALSIWQALHTAEISGVDVVSFGSERSGTSEYAAKQAAKYRHVIIWCDNAENATAAALAAGGAFALRSPRGQDANDLLQQGILPAFIAGALERFGLREREPEASTPAEALVDWAMVRQEHAQLYHGGQLVEWRPRADGNGIGCPLCWPPAEASL